MSSQDKLLHSVFLMSLLVMAACVVIMASVFVSDRYNTIQYIENLHSAAIQKCPGALTILKYIETKIKSICDECTLEQKCLKPFLEYISVRAVLQVLR